MLPKNEEVVERLYLVALFRTMTIGHHRGRGNKGEIPPDAEQDQRGPEMRNRDAGKSDDSGRGQQTVRPPPPSRHRTAE